MTWDIPGGYRDIHLHFPNETRKKHPSYFRLYWLVHRDPYNGLLKSLYNWVGNFIPNKYPTTNPGWPFLSHWLRIMSPSLREFDFFFFHPASWLWHNSTSEILRKFLKTKAGRTARRRRDVFVFFPQVSLKGSMTNKTSWKGKFL